MWKEMYCFALRIDTVLPDWRGFIGLGSEPALMSSSGPDRFETRRTAAHPERDMCTKPCVYDVCVLLQKHVHVCRRSCVVSITFAWLLCARRESPLRWSDEIQSIESTGRW